MSEARVFKKNKNMVCRVIGGETLLLPIYKSSEEINCIYTLNPAAAWVWERLDGKRTLADIKREAAKAYEAAVEQVEKKFAALMKDLEEIKAVEVI